MFLFDQVMLYFIQKGHIGCFLQDLSNDNRPNKKPVKLHHWLDCSGTLLRLISAETDFHRRFVL